MICVQTDLFGASITINTRSNRYNGYLIEIFFLILLNWTEFDFRMDR